MTGTHDLSEFLASLTRSRLERLRAALETMVLGSLLDDLTFEVTPEELDRDLAFGQR